MVGVSLCSEEGWVAMNHRSPLSSIIVVALAGRVGSGVSFVRDKLHQELTTYGYKTDIVDVSQVVLIENYEQYSNDDAVVDLDGMTRADRSRELQRRGNYLRENGGSDFIARMTFLDVIWEDLKDKDECEGGRLGERRAYIVDSFKHPEEALFFRNVFGDAFYLIAVVADEHIRKSRLIERKNYSEKEYEDIADRDAGEDSESGQHAIETIVEADYFFENNFHTKDQISKEAERFLRLVFRTSLDSPRKDEEGMALAFQAALKSACLSRQVGASIFSATGQVIATGCNDVPRFGGGLYTTESTPGDKRCWVHGAKCYNDNEKNIIVREIINAAAEEFNKEGGFDDQGRARCEEIVERAVHSSRVKRLLEFLNTSPFIPALLIV